MFGSKEQLSLSLIDRKKLSLIANTYKNAPMPFKVFFDRQYRPERYRVMTEEISKYQNINEFRTFMLSNHHEFPVESTKQVSFWSAPPSSGELESEAPEGNVLLEKSYMKLYWQVFRMQIGVQLALFTTIGYCAVTMPARLFNASAFRSIAGVGFALQSYVIYLKRIKLGDYERQIATAYEKQIGCYERFLYDKELE